MEEDGQPDIKPIGLIDNIQYALTCLRLVTDQSLSLAKAINAIILSEPKLIEKVKFMNVLELHRQQYLVYQLLREVAEYSQNTKDEEQQFPGRKAKNHIEPSDDSQLQKVFEIILSQITPFGSLQRIPYEMKDNVISANFTVRFLNTSEEGLYHLYFHNCAELNVESGKRHSVNLTLKMVEKNINSYLSAGQQPLPMLYAISCLAYLFLSIFWFVYLRKSKNSVYRIHYLMLAVTVVKSISLGFHSVNYYVIGKHGAHEESWAVMYYITHIIRGALLFITILLIGAGWAFIKHMLTPRERNVFLIVVPLQVLANIATIIIEESEAGAARYATWKEIFIFVDLACCGAILFPVVWSIRLLKAASQTDGKAAINLRNLRLFRHFYILVICYVYFTRVIVYLMTITVVYSYSWLVELFKETVTFIFFISVGYEFRPVNDNPYLLVSDEDDGEDTVMERMQMEDIWSQSGLTDGVTRVQRSQSKRKSNIPMKTYPKSQDKESLLQGVENA
ncbi:hypothetical protein MS3_00001864 [Schistosoma haematobium]|uniref:GOST seven transmembrane domain-containing protein n=1 Tax=Schistosoma haematobium TaxID=6185 RepID=A0A922S6V1_SCHHA|nr:hypothetical protein MS3_00001864 [Schistosoma haematobium]KAH9596042.1 hypothetical protein MS3_00001864 [Schistosoma haematobium]